MRTPTVLIGLVTLGLMALTASCGLREPAAQPLPLPDEAVASPEAPAAPMEPTPVVLGQWFDIADQTGVMVARAAFTALDLDPPCSHVYGGTSPADGHYMEIQMRIQTTAAYTGESGFGYPSAYDFDVTPSGGPTEGDVYPEAGTALCLPPDREEFGHSNFTANGDYEGWVLVQTQHDAGRLMYAPHFLASVAGWSISYPA